MKDDTVFYRAVEAAIEAFRDSHKNEITRVNASPITYGAVVTLTTRNAGRGGHIQQYTYEFTDSTGVCVLENTSL